MFDFLPLKYRSRWLLANQATGTGAEAYLVPTAGSKAVNIRCLVTMGNAANLVLSLKYSDDASGTNATALTTVVPIFVNGVEQTAAVTHTVSDATGNFTVDFCIDPGLVPASKYIGISYGDSNASNLLSVQMVEDVAYRPTAA